jgi:methionyl-tRNA formyltransferase
LKLCIAGKNQIAVNVLLAVAQRYDVVCLPNDSDAGEDTWQPSLRKMAAETGVPIVTLADVQGEEKLCLLSLEYDKLIKPDRFSSKKLFNIHFSLLPAYGGCNTSIWPILNGEEYHGVTLHEIDAGMDTGAIIDQRRFPIGNMSSHELYMACMMLGLKMSLEWLPSLMAGNYTATPQDPASGSTYYRRQLDYSAKEIDPSETTEEVLRRVRAFTFPAYQLPTLNGAEIKEARVSAGEEAEGWTRVRTRDGALDIRFT